MFSRLCSVVVLLVVVAGMAVAQSTEFKLALGTFQGTECGRDQQSHWSYSALTFDADYKDECLYGELAEDYQLFIWNHSFGKWSSVIRADDRLVRVGIQAPIADTGWSARFLSGAMSDRLDIYTKALQVLSEAESGAGFTIDGWGKFEKGCKPDPRIGFNFAKKKAAISLWYNLRSEEMDSVYATIPPWKF